MNINCFWYSGNDLKSGKVISRMGGRFRPESVAGLNRNLHKDELTDIQEVVMIYSPTDAERKITEKSAVQEKLWKIFELKKIEKQLSLHK
ncbi:MAG: hypothetical protein LWX54_13175 [Deltaproteobacteria bacterium]|jgi:hypothetical protein|nr:hypothetical protein [Deltaproteobacteria bacterium]